MFTIDTLVDNATKTTKATIAHIPNEDIRNGFETMVDAHATFAKTMYNTGFELAKSVADSLITFAPKQTVAKK
jgi:hypothetical protein